MRGKRKSSPVSSLASTSVIKKEKIEEIILMKDEPIEDQVEVDEVLKNMEICPFCEKSFQTISKMEIHVRNAHKNPYECVKCKKSYFSQKALEKHKIVHLPNYYFECTTCHQKYKTEKNLKRHQNRSHSDLKRFYDSELQMCHICGIKVKNLKRHELRHERQSRGTIYPCPRCLKKFLSITGLENHFLVHKQNFKCEECGKEYRGPRELSSHKRKHQLVINTCKICDKDFSSIGNFHLHILTHAGIKPYKCDICDEHFTQRTSLLRHRKNHPGPLPILAASNPHIAELARSYLEVLDSSDEKLIVNSKK